ncbi:MAG: threonine--tRNA ligase [Planctomycetota bacterium]|nr:MAG: threonine--tRNA ligase [Planctomycetota bacterium]
MPVYTLPDGKQIAADQPQSGYDIAMGIAEGLAKRALAVQLDDEDIIDLNRPITRDARVRLITPSNDDPAALEVLRHSCAHVLAEAICELFPGTRLAYGPAVDDGFFYDLATPRPVSVDDFDAIEAAMARIIKEDRPFIRCEFSPEQGLARTADDKYKHDNAERAIARGAETISFYRTGDGDSAWEDLCAGPHVPRTGVLAACKVMSVAGAYWHGDQTSDQLTRIYGTCFADKKGLKAHLQRLEEAKARDHRKLGRELQLFHIPEENPGQIFWHPKGWTLYRCIENYVRQRIEAAGYIEVRTPALQPQALWERSGHWAKYRENMFITHEQDRGGKPETVAVSDQECEDGGCGHDHHQEAGQEPAAAVRTFALKPMNCPGHIEIFKQGLKSYRDLPMRMAEFGACVRYEPSGALHGIMRVRGFVQDDAHIFCSEDQIGSEVADFCDLLKGMYSDFGFPAESVRVKFATRPPVRVGSDADWDRAEAALEQAVKQANLSVQFNPGEGAFYGPKLEFVLTDCLGRDWQCGTIQVDYLLAGPDRLNATYVAEDGSRKHPVILHRAILGSLERFIGILIEHYAGKFPLWLAPEQIRVLPISDQFLDYADKVTAQLRSSGLRVQLDRDPDKLGAKIRSARNDRVPYFAVVGEAERDAGTIALQRQDGSKVGTLSISEACALLSEEANSRSSVPAAMQD